MGTRLRFLIAHCLACQLSLALARAPIVMSLENQALTPDLLLTSVIGVIGVTILIHILIHILKPAAITNSKGVCQGVRRLSQRILPQCDGSVSL